MERAKKRVEAKRGSSTKLISNFSINGTSINSDDVRFTGEK